MVEVIQELDRLVRARRPNARVFISYRRDDALDATDRLYTELAAQLGEDSIMMDVDSIPSGADYREYIQQAIEGCEAVLVVIGNHWLNVVDSTGKRRLDDPEDFVHLEITLALKLGKHVIPVLVGRGTMPSAEELPAELQSLAYRNATEVRAGRDYSSHVKRLIDRLRKLLDPDAS